MKRAPRAALGVALATALVPAAAAEEPWQAQDGPLRAELVLSDQAKALQASWNEKPGDAAPPGLASAAPGTRAETVVFFTGCQPDGDGSCKIWGIASVSAPDGSVLAAAVEIPLSLERPPPAPPALAVSQHGIGLVVRESEGAYTFKMQVIDRVAGHQVMLVRELPVARAD
jgi:hypothetical protein